jgi:serine/threonine-protein kinase
VAGYLLEEQIGAGGMAVVFRAHDVRLDRTVALKILAPGLAADDAFRQRFIRESRAAAAVDDPHIIPVFEAGESQGVLFIAMRFVPGGDARSLVGRYGRLPAGRAVELVSQVATALDAAHGRGLVHRDVKPANILLDAGGGGGRPDHVYLSDFGLSKGSLQQSGLTGTGTFLGTLDYVAPEQIEGRPVDGRADEYALACAAFELLSGSPPFARSEAMAVMYAQLNEPAPALSGRVPGMPTAVDAVFARALAKAPADRYGSCREFADALRHALGLTPYDSGPSRVYAAEHPPTEAMRAAAETAAPAKPGGVPPGPGALRGAGAAAEVTTGIGAEATRVAGASGGVGRATAPDLTPAYGYGQPAQDTGQVRPRRLSRGVLIGAVVVLLAAAAGAYVAFGRGSGTHGHGNGHGVHHVTPLVLPGLSTGTAAAQDLRVPNQFVPVSGGNPFGVAASADGKFVFAVTATGVDVLAAGPGLTLTPRSSYGLNGTAPNAPATGAAITHNGRYLLVAVGNGIDVMNVASMEAGAASAAMGTLAVPNLSGYGRGVQVAVTPNGHYAFVALQFKSIVAMFDLRQALRSGFSTSGYIGALNVGAQPVGVTVSPNGKLLYTASWGSALCHGALSVIDISKAAANPSSAPAGQVTGLCDPARIALSSDGGTVWATVRFSNYLLGFSAKQIVTAPGKALIAKVQVGPNPVGIALVNGGSTIVVADTNDQGGGTPGLAVIDVTAALARQKSALLGYITSSQGPHELAVPGTGQSLYASDYKAGQLQVVDLSKLPH